MNRLFKLFACGALSAVVCSVIAEKIQAG